MIAERVKEEEKFIPIVLTLETREELEGLFHLANCTPFTTFNEYRQNIGRDRVGDVNLLAVKVKLYNTLQEFFYGRR